MWTRSLYFVHFTGSRNERYACFLDGWFARKKYRLLEWTLQKRDHSQRHPNKCPGCQPHSNMCLAQSWKGCRNPGDLQAAVNSSQFLWRLGPALIPKPKVQPSRLVMYVLKQSPVNCNRHALGLLDWFVCCSALTALRQHTRNLQFKRRGSLISTHTQMTARYTTT